MTHLGRLSRAAALLGLLATGATPTFAAPADVALIKSYLGDWRGRGTLMGAGTEPVVCRLSLKEGNADKVNYSGRCTIAGSTLSINGTIAYIEEAGRYEAAMTSNVAFSGIAVGQRRGDSVIFNLRERDVDEGQDVTITAQITLRSTGIHVGFNVVYEQSGDSLYAEVPFDR